MTLTNTFIIRYNNLPEVNRYYYSHGRKKEWYLRKENLIQYLKSGDNEIDFLWHSVVFNLFSKTLYSYSPENYKYCNDFIHWKYGHHNVLYKVYFGKFKNFIDDNCSTVPQELREIFYNYSKNKVDAYCKYFLGLIGLFADECCEINCINLINKAKESAFFKEEFSDLENDLSNIFLRNLYYQILQ